MGTTIEIGELSGAALAGLLGGSTGGRNFTYRIGAKTPRGSVVNFAGTIAEQNAATSTSFVKTGAGTWMLTGSCLWHGGTTVEQGTLRIAGAVESRGANFSVLDGATLDLADGTVTMPDLRISQNAKLTGRGTIAGDFTNHGTATVGSGALAITGDVVNNGTMCFTGGAALTAARRFVNNGTLDLLTGAQQLPADFENSGVVIDSSSLRRTRIAMNGATETVTVQTYSGHVYQLQWAGSLTAPAWTNVGAAQVGDGTERDFIDPATSGTQRFYRVVVTP